VHPLERFVPRAAAEWDLDAPGRKWQEIDGTLCLVDLSGFTGLSERLAARGRIGIEELTELLNRVFGTMLDLASARRGSMLKFGGDALLLLFIGDDHAMQAASAAVEMRAALHAATRVPLSVGRVQLRMSVGLHSGLVQLFRVGSAHHELLVTGPAATRTTQIEHAAAAGEILVSAELADRLPHTATRPGPSGVCRLRWRRAPVSPVGHAARRAVDTDALGACLPAILRDHLQHGGAEFEHRIATVAFLRFRGVDGVLASRGPDDVAEALERLVSMVQEVAEAESVTFLASDIDEDGGKLILVTGVPRTQTDDEGRMLRTLRALADADVALSVQMGVNHGHVFAGPLGASRRGTFTVMGDTVNLAARLMAAAPTGEVYATLDVLARSRHAFDATPTEPFLVRGKAQPVQAFILGEETGARPPDANVGPFIGRTEELALLEAAFGDAAIVTVVGDTGIGKSRLVVEGLARTGRGSLIVRGEPNGLTSPYRAVRDAFRSILGIERDDEATMGAQLEASVRRIDPQLLPLLPLLGTVAHIATPMTPEVGAVDPQFLPEQLGVAVRRLLEAVLPEGAVLVVDDAQWTDPASDALLGRLAVAAERGRRWSMVVVRRDAAGGFAPESRLLRLGPMDDRYLRELLTQLTSEPLRPDEVQGLVSRAAGSPLVLDALVQLGRERAGADDLPESLEEAIAAEIDVLAPLPRALLRYLSVLGRSFHPRVGQELVADLGLALDDAMLDDLRRFLDIAVDEIRFRQAVVRDVAYQNLPYRRRRELHLRAGEVIERATAGAVDSAAGLLSLHFYEAGEYERAWRYARIAATTAEAAFATVEAAALYRRALDAARRCSGVSATEQVETWISLGDVLERSGRFDDALSAYRRATPLTGDDAVARAKTLLKRAHVRERAGGFVAAQRELRSAERAVADDRSDDAERVRTAAATLRAIVYQGKEQPRRALRVAEKAAADAEQLGELHDLARAYSVMDWAHLSLGTPELAVHQPRAIEIYESLGLPHRAAKALANLGALHFWAGRWTDAEECYRRAHEALVRTGDVVTAGLAQANIAELLVNRGQYGAARELAIEAGQTHRAVGYTDGALFDDILLGRVLLGEGKVDGAARILGAVVEQANALALHGTALEASVYLASCLLEGGQAREALATLARAERLAGTEAQLFAAAAEYVRARALFQCGDADEARRRRRLGIEAARRMEQRYELGLLLVLADDGPDAEEGRSLLASLEVPPVLVSG
jgi:class 3 adenylate cyclase/tetratricopeptide (TPR) repeat protein